MDKHHPRLQHEEISSASPPDIQNLWVFPSAADVHYIPAERAVVHRAALIGPCPV